jgi:RNA polymerase sigma-70 factor (ECF subfamily)
MNSIDKLIDQVLLLRCQIGDRDAFAELIKRYEKPLRYFVCRLLDDAQIAEDIFQETWLTVIRQIHTLRDADAFRAWLYRVARNKVYQQLRTKNRFSPLDENTAIINGNHDDVFCAEDAAKIHKCLKKLVPEHREVLMLRFLEQMSYQQIAEVLNCNPGTVKSRIYYAKRSLREKMEA